VPSARKRAHEIQDDAARRYANAKRRRSRAFHLLESETERRRRFAVRKVSRELKRFHESLSNFAEFVLATQREHPDAPAFAEFDNPTLRRIEGAAAAAVKTAGLGGVAGGAAASGTYAIVATYGSASTGTAIATLHGVALSNATLAALGGGSLATGGGGIALGTAVLGGIAVAPVVLLGGIVYWQRGRKSLAQAKANVAEIDAAIAKLDADRARIDRVRALVERLFVATETLVDALSDRLDHIAEWGAPALADLATAQQGYLARTVAIAETLLVVGSVPAWSENGNPARRGQQAANAAYALLAAKVS
jgi:hypothetical protein